MWFKNLSLYRFTENFTLKPEQFEEKLAQMPFKPCAPHQDLSFGWTSPLGLDPGQLVHVTNSYLMVCGKTESKVLPAAVINEMTADRISDQESRQNRKLSKKERTALKEEVVFELLPKAFSMTRNDYAYIDPKQGWLIVDAASPKKAEAILGNLRKCLGTLPVVPPVVQNKPGAVMTHWLMTQNPPGDISIEDECELRALEEEGGIIRCKRHDLGAPEIKNHLENGKVASKLALNWADRLAFVLDENLAIKRLRFLDLVQDQLSDIESMDEIERFDADFAIMSLELARFLPRLIELFGGESSL